MQIGRKIDKNLKNFYNFINSAKYRAMGLLLRLWILINLIILINFIIFVDFCKIYAIISLSQLPMVESGGLE